MKLLFSFRLLFLIIFYIKFNQTFSKIIFVFEHVRHGTRTPPFSEDSNYIDQFGTKWEGNGELTAVGKRLHTILGIQNRIKYSSLMNYKKLDPKEIKIVSTNSIRTIKSLQAQLHAMFIPGTGDVLSEQELNISYPPGKEFLPIDTEKEINKLDNYAVFNRTNLFPIEFFATGKVFPNEPDLCPYMTEYRKILVQKTYKESLSDFLEHFKEKFGDKLSEYLNKKNSDWIHDYDQVIGVTDNYICNYDNGKNLDDFLNKTGFNKEEFYNYSMRVKEFYLFNLSCDETTGTLGATPHMKDLIEYMDKKVKNDSYYSYSAPKMVIQGGHDTTINLIQYFMFSAFNIPVKYVKFGANIYFELHKNEFNNNINYIVKYFYDGEELLNIDYYEFKRKVNEVVWSDEKIKNFCYRKNDESKNDDNSFKINTLSLILIITNGIFFISTIIFLILFFYYKKKYNNIERTSVAPFID
jgi:hypothetical protein